MRVARFDLTPELFVEICKVLKDGPPRYIEVIKNPLPDDAKIVDIRLRNPYLPHTLQVLVESSSFEDIPEGVEPPELPMILMQTVYQEVSEMIA